MDPDLEVVHYVGDFGYDMISTLEVDHVSASSSKFCEYDITEHFTPGAFEVLILS